MIRSPRLKNSAISPAFFRSRACKSADERKGRKRQRKALLEASPALLEYITAVGINDDLEGPE
jgi:hypothetical protein